MPWSEVIGLLFPFILIMGGFCWWAYMMVTIK